MFVGYGGYWLTERDRQGIVAVVGSSKIRAETLRARADLYAERLRQQGTELDDAKLAELKREVLMSLMVDELLALQADQLGLTVSDAELARDIRAVPAFSRGGQFDQPTYFQAVRRIFHESPREYEKERRAALKAERVKVLFLRMCKISPAEAREAYAAANKGSLKDFDKTGPDFVARLQQQRAFALINYALRQLQARDQIRVENRIGREESGA